jgi:demethylmenaquinone methyltransferase/2-methoxy-6-polyprenyl-1,4-benzoquinol methylase
MSPKNALISPVERTKLEARAFYDRISPYYDWIAASEDKFVRRGLNMLDLQPGDRVLEIGSGTGKALLVLAEAVGETGHVFGIDISPGMTGVARKRLRKHSLEDQVDLTVDDASQLPFASGVMEAVFMSFTLELFHIPEIAQVLSECDRVLKPDGQLGVVSLDRKVPLNLVERAYEWLHERFPKALDCRPIPVRAELERAGFQIEQDRQERMWGLSVRMVVAGR